MNNTELEEKIVKSENELSEVIRDYVDTKYVKESKSCKKELHARKETIEECEELIKTQKSKCRIYRIIAKVRINVDISVIDNLKNPINNRATF